MCMCDDVEQRSYHTGLKPTYDNMHAQACQVSCCLKPHSSGTPRHNGNPSILLGQDCVRGKKGPHENILHLFCNLITARAWIIRIRTVHIRLGSKSRVQSWAFKCFWLAEKTPRGFSIIHWLRMDPFYHWLCYWLSKSISLSLSHCPNSFRLHNSINQVFFQKENDPFYTNSQHNWLFF